MEALPQYQTYNIPVSDIFVDPDFNCRQDFTLESLRELANSIRENGLRCPAIVQPWTGTQGSGGCRYRLVAGHRRLKAMVAHLGATTIPAMVVTDLANDFAARKLNLLENIDRQDLNMREVAIALRRLYPDATNEQIGKSINRSRGWVATRMKLLDLPEEVQGMAAAGLLRHTDIDALAQMTTGDHRVTAAAGKVIRERKKHKRRRPKVEGVPYKRPLEVRAKAAINTMVARLLDEGISGLAPRLGAWCAGELSNDEIDEDIQQEIGKMQNQTGSNTASRGEEQP